MKKEVTPPPGYLFSRSYTNYVFILLFLLYLFDYADRMVVSSIGPFIQKEWNLNDKQLSMFLSVVYWSIVALTFPASLLVDRWSRRKTIGIMAALWSVASLACAFTNNFRQLFTARLFIGVGESGYAPGGTAMIAGMYPERKRSLMMGIWNAAIPLGSAVGVALGGIIATHWGWRHAFGLVALPGFIVAVLFFFVRDYKTVSLVKNGNNAKEQEKVKMGLKDIVAEFFERPSLLFTYLGITGVVFVTNSILFWLATYFNRIYNLPMDKAGPKASLVMLLALIGAPIGGLITDKWKRTRPNARLLFPAISTFLSAIFLFLAFVVFSGSLQYIMLLLMGACISAFIPAAAAVTQDLVHPGLRATSYAIAVVIQNLLGSSLGPLIVGAISDKHGIQQGMSILPLFLVLAAILFFTGSFRYQKDVSTVEKIQLEPR